MARYVQADREARARPTAPQRVVLRPMASDDAGFRVTVEQHEGRTLYRVSGGRPERWVHQTDFTNDEAVGYLADRLARAGVEDALYAAGAVAGAEVVIGSLTSGVVFDWQPTVGVGGPLAGPRGTDIRVEGDATRASRAERRLEHGRRMDAKSAARQELASERAAGQWVAPAEGDGPTAPRPTDAPPDGRRRPPRTADPAEAPEHGEQAEQPGSRRSSGERRGRRRRRGSVCTPSSRAPARSWSRSAPRAWPPPRASTARRSTPSSTGSPSAARAGEDRRLVVVTSGAIAAGLPALGMSRRPADLAGLQAAASVGQGRLLARWSASFARHDLVTGQVLLDLDDLVRRNHYLNARSTLARLLSLGAVPVVNENDTVATDEIRFGDNDRLAAFVAHLVGASALVLLTDVDGLYDRPPSRPGARRIPLVDGTAALEADLGSAGSAVGTGGMRTKVDAATIAADAAVPTLVTATARFADALAGDDVGTWFEAAPRALPARTLWLAHVAAPRGRLLLDAGAVRAVLRRGASLLPAGHHRGRGRVRRRRGRRPVRRDRHAGRARADRVRGRRAAPPARPLHPRPARGPRPGLRPRGRPPRRPGRPPRRGLAGSPRRGPGARPGLPWAHDRRPARALRPGLPRRCGAGPAAGRGQPGPGRRATRSATPSTPSAPPPRSPPARCAPRRARPRTRRCCASPTTSSPRPTASWPPTPRTSPAPTRPGCRRTCRTGCAWTRARIEAIAAAVRDVVALADPVGEVVRGSTLPNGLRVRQVRRPLGVVGMVYEARPNVTVDAAALALKSGNAVVLRGGSAAAATNAAVVDVLRGALEAVGLPADLVSTIDAHGREGVRALLRARGLVDVVIPRGGADLIRTVVETATVPTIETGTGNCHVYVDAAADLDEALAICLNAKVQRPGVCNSAETVLVHGDVADRFVPVLAAAMAEAGRRAARRRGHPRAGRPGRGAARHRRGLGDGVPRPSSSPSAWSTTSTRRSPTSTRGPAGTPRPSAPATPAPPSASWPRSTPPGSRSTPPPGSPTGRELGLGAEIGISTQKLHARGPMGLAELTTTTWVMTGDGHVRG